MMYKNQFVVAVKSSGRVLREVGDTVYLPFGCEYSLLLKNLNIVRADVRITIDGEDVLGGRSLVVSPNSNLEIERFIKDVTQGNRFKFIERTSSVEQHRGVGAGDGLIRIEWQFEKPRPVYQVRPDPFANTWGGSGGTPWIAASGSSYSTNNSTPLYRSLVATSASVSPQSMNVSASAASAHDGAACMDWNDSVMAKSVNDVGITVPGSMSQQRFTTVDSFPLEDQKHVIVLQLKGETGDAKVSAPVTVKAKPKCVTCGKVNKATAKFCSNCGTALDIV